MSRGMDDSFNFGTPGRKRPRAPQVNFDPKIFLLAGGLLIAVAMVFVYMKFVSKAGHEVASDQVSVVKQVDRAKDVEAQVALRNALSAAKVAFIDGGQSYTGAGPAQLSALEPSFTYVDGPSTGPTVVSVANTDKEWAGAVKSNSGTCFWIVDAGLNTYYGTGSTCTGQAAMGARGTSW